MAGIEDELHELFKDSHVKLEKSKEWFDLTPWQYYRCLWAFKSRELFLFSLSEIPLSKIVKSLLAIALISTLGAAYIYAPARIGRESIEMKFER